MPIFSILCSLSAHTTLANVKVPLNGVAGAYGLGLVTPFLGLNAVASEDANVVTISTR